jgi:hypothetical protein
MMIVRPQRERELLKRERNIRDVRLRQCAQLIERKDMDLRTVKLDLLALPLLES